MNWEYNAFRKSVPLIEPPGCPDLAVSTIVASMILRLSAAFFIWVTSMSVDFISENSTYAKIRIMFYPQKQYLKKQDMKLRTRKHYIMSRSRNIDFSKAMTFSRCDSDSKTDDGTSKKTSLFPQK